MTEHTAAKRKPLLNSKRFPLPFRVAAGVLGGRA